MTSWRIHPHEAFRKSCQLVGMTDENLEGLLRDSRFHHESHPRRHWAVSQRLPHTACFGLFFHRVRYGRGCSPYDTFDWRLRAGASDVSNVPASTSSLSIMY